MAALSATTLETWLHCYNVKTWQHWVQPLWRRGYIVALLHCWDMATLLYPAFVLSNPGHDNFSKNDHWNVIQYKNSYNCLLNYKLYIYIYNCVQCWRKFINKFLIFSFGQNFNKIWIFKLEVLCNVQMKYGLNKIKITQQVEWLGGKGVELHPWCLRIKLHKWHLLWSTLEYWLNNLYLLRLGGYLNEFK